MIKRRTKSEINIAIDQALEKPNKPANQAL